MQLNLPQACSHIYPPIFAEGPTRKYTQNPLPPPHNWSLIIEPPTLTPIALSTLSFEWNEVGALEGLWAGQGWLWRWPWIGLCISTRKSVGRVGGPTLPEISHQICSLYYLTFFLPAGLTTEISPCQKPVLVPWEASIFGNNDQVSRCYSHGRSTSLWPSFVSSCLPNKGPINLWEHFMHIDRIAL